MLIRQVESGPTALARLMAAESLSKQASPQAIETLENVLAKESEFWMVRQAAAQGLGKMQTQAANGALLRAERKGIGHPRVLAAVLAALGNYIVSEDAHEAVLRHAGPRSKLYVQTAAVSALGKLRASPDLIDKSLKTLQEAASKSARRAVRSAAFEALASLDDPRAFKLVMELGQPSGQDELRSQVIPVLGRLGRRAALRDRARTALTAWLYDPDRTIPPAAAAGLGSLGDPRSIADLERIRNSVRDAELRQAASRAIAGIRSPQDPKEATGALIRRLEAIEKQNQELANKLKELTQKIEAKKRAEKREGKVQYQR
jgi:HEAT repeat protein